MFTLINYIIIIRIIVLIFTLQRILYSREKILYKPTYFILIYNFIQ